MTKYSRHAIGAAQPRVRKERVSTVMRRLAKAIDGLDEPAVEKIADEQLDNAFQVLIATMLSAQTRDAVTSTASRRLFAVARNPGGHGRADAGADPEADLSRSASTATRPCTSAIRAASCSIASAAAFPRRWPSC